MRSTRIFNAAAVIASVVQLTFFFPVPAAGHDTSNLRPVEDPGVRGEARIDDDEIRVRGDRLDPSIAVDVRIANGDGELETMFETTTDRNGSFDVRSSAGSPASFAGRSVVVVSDGAVLLEGSFPSSVDRDEAGVGTAPLVPSEGVSASGRIRVKSQESRRSIEVRVRDAAGDVTLSACISNADGITEALGSITTSDGGNGALKVDSEDGGALPFGAGNVNELAGTAVTVKDSEGNVLLSGTVPLAGQRVDDDELELQFDLARPGDSSEPAIRGDVKFETEPQRDTVRVRVDDATAGADYMVRIRAAATDENPDPAPERITILTTDEDGEVEFEHRGRPISPSARCRWPTWKAR